MVCGVSQSIGTSAYSPRRINVIWPLTGVANVIHSQLERPKIAESTKDDGLRSDTDGCHFLQPYLDWRLV